MDKIAKARQAAQDTIDHLMEFLEKLKSCDFGGSEELKTYVFEIRRSAEATVLNAGKTTEAVRKSD